MFVPCYHIDIGNICKSNEDLGPEATTTTPMAEMILDTREYKLAWIELWGIGRQKAKLNPCLIQDCEQIFTVLFCKVNRAVVNDEKVTMNEVVVIEKKDNKAEEVARSICL